MRVFLYFCSRIYRSKTPTAYIRHINVILTVKIYVIRTGK